MQNCVEIDMGWLMESIAEIKIYQPLLYKMFEYKVKSIVGNDIPTWQEAIRALPVTKLEEFVKAVQMAVES